MSYLFLAVSLVLSFLLIVSRGIFYKNYDQINLNMKSRLDGILKVIYIAPVVVLGIISVLIFIYFKSKGFIRISHAWFVVNFWICSVSFYYITIQLGKIRRIAIVVPVLGMAISVGSAIFLTTLQHYQSVFHNVNLIIPSLFALVMLIITYHTNYKFLRKKF